MGVWLFAIYALAVARLTGLVTVDAITDPIRSRMIRAIGSPELPWLGKDQPLSTQDIIDWLRDAKPVRWALAKLVTCQWCASVWIAFAFVPVVHWFGHTLWVLLPATALAASQLTGMLSDLGRRE